MRNYKFMDLNGNMMTVKAKRYTKAVVVAKNLMYFPICIGWSKSDVKEKRM